MSRWDEREPGPMPLLPTGLPVLADTDYLGLWKADCQPPAAGEPSWLCYSGSSVPGGPESVVLGGGPLASPVPRAEGEGSLVVAMEGLSLCDENPSLAQPCPPTREDIEKQVVGTEGASCDPVEWEEDGMEVV